MDKYLIEEKHASVPINADLCDTAEYKHGDIAHQIGHTMKKFRQKKGS